MEPLISYVPEFLYNIDLPRLSNILSIASTSRIAGRLLITHASSVNAVAAIMGKAAFLFPETVISPFNEKPPSIINFYIFIILFNNVFAFPQLSKVGEINTPARTRKNRLSIDGKRLNISGVSYIP